MQSFLFEWTHHRISARLKKYYYHMTLVSIKNYRMKELTMDYLFSDTKARITFIVKLKTSQLKYCSVHFFLVEIAAISFGLELQYQTNKCIGQVIHSGFHLQSSSLDYLCAVFSMLPWKCY